MPARVSIKNPEDVEITFALTLKVAEWRVLMREQPTTQGPGERLAAMIAQSLGEIIVRNERVFSTNGYWITEEQSNG